MRSSSERRGKAPDALVLCHEPGRKTLHGYPHVPIVPLRQAISGYSSAARMTNPNARFVGVSLPCVDPVRTGVAPIIAALEE